MFLSPIVNTDMKMSAKMLEALGLHETRCVVTNVNLVTEKSVKSFLTDRYGEKFANTFNPKFLFNSPNASTNH
jgi:phage baseplate assembly protein W